MQLHVQMGAGACEVHPVWQTRRLCVQRQSAGVPLQLPTTTRLPDDGQPGSSYLQSPLLQARPTGHCAVVVHAAMTVHTEVTQSNPA